MEKEVGLRSQPTEEEKRITKELLERQETMAINGAHIITKQGTTFCNIIMHLKFKPLESNIDYYCSYNLVFAVIIVSL